MLLGFCAALHSREECLAPVELGQAAHSNPIMKSIMILLKSLPKTVDSTDVQRSARRNPVAAVDPGFCAASRPSTERWGCVGGGCRETGHVNHATKIGGMLGRSQAGRAGRRGSFRAAAGEPRCAPGRGDVPGRCRPCRLWLCAAADPPFALGGARPLGGPVLRRVGLVEHRGGDACFLRARRLLRGPGCTRYGGCEGSSRTACDGSSGRFSTAGRSSSL